MKIDEIPWKHPKMLRGRPIDLYPMGPILPKNGSLVLRQYRGRVELGEVFGNVASDHKIKCRMTSDDRIVDLSNANGVCLL